MQAETTAPALRADAGRGSVGLVQALLSQALRQLDDLKGVDRAACARYIAEALRIHRDGAPTPARETSGLAAWQVRVVNDVALAHLDAPLAIVDLAAACRLSRGYFTRAFKVTFGESPHRWRHHRRLEHACHRLSHSDEAIADIAMACGFNDQAHFTRAFKRAYDTTPHAWRVNQLI
ncbi:helix-turn-helix transcriptional regulator [Luteibacter aegosomaticola]|uniref:helix-turn-helix transcriptional regulator n=1 Tax=Luteibacter aegosomaticola TaxID=2911538 RepID=UPI001FFB9723|nr:helix-turn-helix transcriptional regulator [Luteibacter aegosomaticola]UPG88018.1 helix-turn-helix transcriptional regulator [Luteibacter aegosomaticola]